MGDSERKLRMYMATVSAPTNIAVVKYWGKADAEWNTPINDSLSVTLDQADLRAVTTVATGPDLTNDRLWLNGVEDSTVASNGRFRATVDGCKALATDLKDDKGNPIVRADEWRRWKVHVSSYNTFPTAAGLASSAAGYAALAAALSELYSCREDYPGQLSTAARQGSGSACRSLYGGLVAWRAGKPGPDGRWTDSVAVQITDEKHWPEMRAVILVVSDKKKDTSSTAGMGTSVATSALLKHRAEAVVPDRMKIMEEAWRNRDFPTFAEHTMRDSNQFHACCQDTYPPIFYMNDVSRQIVRLVHAYNAWRGETRCSYTFDAGPNAVLYLLEEDLLAVVALFRHYFPPPSLQEGREEEEYILAGGLTAIGSEQIDGYEMDRRLLAACDRTGRVPTVGDVKKMYVTKAGPGPQVLSPSEACNLDRDTGLNTYAPSV